jgi:N-carbamoylputrescine amidase
MKIALVQQRATPNLAENLRRGIEAFRRASDEGARLIAYAELAFLSFLPQVPVDHRTELESYAQPVPGPITEEFSALAKRYRVVAVLNLFEKAGGRTYDSSPVIDADGRLLGATRMVHIMEGPGFHESGYYAPGDQPIYVYETALGKVGVAICYDRHFPEYMRMLALQGAEIVIIPQAGTVGEWGEGIFEGEVRIAAFQNGYFAALVNRVGREEVLHFAGESFVADPFGRVIARAPRGEDHILYADCDFGLISGCPAKTHFLPDRRPGLYKNFKLTDEK